MPPTDLEGRLRRALSVAPEPAATEEARGSLVAALARRRARRRAVAGSAGLGVLAVLGLTLGLAFGLGGSPGAPTAAPAHGGPAAGCVQVQVGARPSSCVGRITSGAGESASAARAAPLGSVSRTTNGAEFAPMTPTTAPTTATIRATAGQRVLVSLPPKAGVSWVRVTLDRKTAPTAAPERLEIRGEHTTGRTVAVVRHAADGSFVLVATGSSTCASGRACVTTTYRWSVDLDVGR